MAIVSTVVLALFALCLIAIPITCGIIVYRDAKAKNMEAWLWAFVAVLLPYFTGLILYLVISRNNTALRCGHCGNAVKPDHAVCPYCGNTLKNTCESCGQLLEPGWKVCPRCGASAPAGVPGAVPAKTKTSRVLWGVLIFAIAAPILLLVFLVVRAYGGWVF
ncbi:MAG: double zinc ribbon domain-containing protein [Oscillospiraceae bacterium]